MKPAATVSVARSHFKHPSGPPFPEAIGFDTEHPCSVYATNAHGNADGRILGLVEGPAGHSSPRQNPGPDDRLELGNPGDIAPIGQGVSELRIHHRPGYRVYVSQRGEEIVILLCGGDKNSQQADIARAKKLAEQYK